MKACVAVLVLALGANAFVPAALRPAARGVVRSVWDPLTSLKARTCSKFGAQAEDLRAVPHHLSFFALCCSMSAEESQSRRDFGAALVAGVAGLGLAQSAQVLPRTSLPTFLRI